MLEGREWAKIAQRRLTEPHHAAVTIDSRPNAVPVTAINFADAACTAGSALHAAGLVYKSSARYMVCVWMSTRGATVPDVEIVPTATSVSILPVPAVVPPAVSCLSDVLGKVDDIPHRRGLDPSRSLF